MTQGRSSDEQKVLEKSQSLFELERKGLNAAESLAFFQCREEYRRALLFIGRYDQGQTELSNFEEEKNYFLEVQKANIIIKNLKDYLEEQGESVTHFGMKNAGDIGSIIGAIYQTYNGKDLYPDVETKAANLLYFLVKDHCFVDGNKRIAAFLFIWFLEMNGKLYIEKDEPVISYGLLYKLTIFLAESAPQSKDTMIALISHIISLPRETLPD